MRVAGGDTRKHPVLLRKILIALAISGITLTASACNTVKGAGRDIESVGQAGSDAIHK